MPQIKVVEYAARDGSEFSYKDAQKIGPVLHELSRTGGVTARDVLDVARSPQSPLHSYFEWDDKVAADEYRLYQARSMMRSIRIRYIEEETGIKREARAFHLEVKKPYEAEARRYRSFEVLHGDTAFAVQMMDSAFEDLQVWKRKYEPYTGMWDRFGECFQSIVTQIDEFSDDYRAHNSADAVDEALRELLAWREQFREGLKMWTEFYRQIRYVFEAIGDAEDVFVRYSERKERICLRCHKAFMSAHAGHRVCDSCFTPFDKGTSGTVEAITQRQKYEDEE